MGGTQRQRQGAGKSQKKQLIAAGKHTTCVVTDGGSAAPRPEFKTSSPTYGCMTSGRLLSLSRLLCPCAQVRKLSGVPLRLLGDGGREFLPNG